MTTVDDVRIQLESINPLDNDITILAQQAGMGKSTWARKYCDRHPEINHIGIISKRHNFLKECKNEITDFSHWEGIGRLCKKHDLPWFKELNLLSDGIICPECSCRTDCEYHEQFKNTYRVGAPTEYLDTEYLDKFEILFIEERITETRRFHYDSDGLEGGLQALVRKTDCQDESDALNEFLDGVKNNDFALLEKYILEITKLKYKYLRFAVNRKDVKFIKAIARLDFGMLRGYLKYGKIYGFDKKEYYEPRIFRAFDMAKKGGKIVLLHAGFDEQLFVDLLDRYDMEFGSSGLRYKVYTSDVKNKNTKCYRITERAFGRNKFEKDNQEFVEKFLIRLNNIYNKNDIYIITYKDLCQPNLPKGEGAELAFGFDSMHFGNTSGLNHIENKAVLVVIGTYSLRIEDKVKKYNELYGANEILQPYKNMTVAQAKRRLYPDYSGTPIEVIQRAEEDNEQYDAIHRNRGLIRDKKIFVLGKVPERIKNEFDFKLVSKSDVDSFMEELRKTSASSPVALDFEKIIELIGQGYNNTEIARKSNMRQQGKYNTRLIKNIREQVTQ